MHSAIRSSKVLIIFLGGTLTAYALNEVHAADHYIDSGTSSVDCQSTGGGVKPGDTITLAGGPRGPLRIRNCSGTAQSPIIIRNDSSANSPVVIRRAAASSGGFVFVLENVEHFVLDGTGGWRGSSGHCGLLDGQRGTNCGIQVTRSVAGDAPTAFLKFHGLFRNYTVRGIKIDGRSWGSDDLGEAGAGVGILQNSPEKSSDHRGYWRENILYEKNYIHNTRTECMYIGPNWNIEAPQIPLRNITIQDTYLHDCGRNAITVKSAVGGTNVVQRNYASRTGLQNSNAGLGAIFGFTTSRLTLRQNTVIESAGQCFGINADRIPEAYAGGYFHAENNLGVRCGSINNPQLGHGISTRAPSGQIQDIVIDYNTIIDSEANGINIGSGADAGRTFVRNNIVTTPRSGQPVSGVGTRENNLTASKEFVRFQNPVADDYRLTDASPARNNGTSPFPGKDLPGAHRPQDGIPDQGAFEGSSEDAPRPLPPGTLAVQ